MTDEHVIEACPLAVVDRRLADAHKLWHQAEQAYFDPEDFRINVQHLIQTLRTVTWILQSHKEKIENFDTWYPVWQERLRQDPVMRWVVESRNKIEKQGDLASKSYIRAEVIASYLRGPSREVESHLFQSPLDVLRQIPARVLHEQVFKHGVLKIERRWVQNDLPECELLDALAVAYGRLSTLVGDAHLQMGFTKKTIHGATFQEIDTAELGGRLPCMIAHEEPRALLLSLPNGERLTIKHENVGRASDLAKLAVERYGFSSPPPLKFDSLQGLARRYFFTARTMFLKDGYHQTFVFLLKGFEVLTFYGVREEDRREKYLMMRHLANEAVRSGADGVMMIGEAWTAEAAKIGAFQYPVDLPDRKEILMLTAANKHGAVVHLSAFIERNGKQVSLGDTLEGDEGTPFMFVPFFEAWGMPATIWDKKE